MSEKQDLIDWIKTFARPKRSRPDQFILDGFGASFYLLLDCTDVEEPEQYPQTIGKCDILVVPVNSDDPPAHSICVVDNANKHGIMRFLAAIGIQRFSDKVKKAFYEGSNPLRCPPSEAITVPAVHRPATGRTIPDLRKMEHVCEFQREIKAQ